MADPDLNAESPPPALWYDIQIAKELGMRADEMDYINIALYQMGLISLAARSMAQKKRK